ncbi:MAG: nucleotide sugar dehydrogenase [Bacteroidota bacterium]|nr:nucleotide sugar dehydrogenase [Bacteroidota bacterium]
MKIKKICCIGAGFVGGPTMAVIALKCPDIDITVVDINKEKINAWNGKLDELPVYEPGLPEIINKVRGVNLFFSTEMDKAIEESEMIFMAVNTPTILSGEGKGYAADLQYIENSAKQIAKAAKSDKIIIEKSTLPVRTAEKVKEILELNKKLNINFEVISNPEFLAEGTAINDLFKSDRVLIGGENTSTGTKAVNLLVDIYKRWIPSDKILTTNVWSSELSKLVSNAMLAQRISSINSISALCEKTGANINEVSMAVGMDTRIGTDFLKSSIGFGGSCFKKDILNLVYIAKHYGLDPVAEYWENVVRINNYQTERFGKKIIEVFNSNLDDKVITILGWAFKKNTNDSRESASIYLAKRILSEGATIRIYDPMVNHSRIIDDIQDSFQESNLNRDKIDKILKKVSICNNPYSAFEESNLVSICTEWDEFIKLDWSEVFNIMKKPSWVFDGRNLLEKDNLEELGFKTFFIGQA